MLHRDIKPSNLLLDASGHVWLADFGLAKSADNDQLTQSGDFIGTLRYMAPERFKGWSDPRSDVYALGLTLFELLALRPAFAEQDRQRLLRRLATENPPPLRKLDRSIPEALETIVLKATEREPAQRYADAEAFADDLDRFLRGEPVAARRSSWFVQFRHWCARKPALASLTGVSILLLLVGTLVSSTYAVRLAGEQTAGREKLRGSYLAQARAGRFSGQPGQGVAGTRGLDGVRLWDLERREELAFFPLGWTHSLEVDSEGTSLLAAGASGLSRWPIRSGRAAGRRRMTVGPEQVLRKPLPEVLAAWPRTPATPTRSLEAGLRDIVEELAAGDSVRINCGGPALAAEDGKASWADRFFRGGWVRTTENTQGSSKEGLPAIYWSLRSFHGSRQVRPGYSVPIVQGRYRVSLHFAEFVPSRRGARVFTVLLEGRSVLESHRVLSQGSANSEIRTFEVDVKDAFLDIDFLAENDEPALSALEIERLGE